jgi:hypothetical protein
MDFEVWAYPVAIIADRYGGIYSGGEWLAIAGFGVAGKGESAARLVETHMTDEVPNPWGDDIMAMDFWESPPNWIAVGNTPDEALAALKRKSGFNE